MKATLLFFLAVGTCLTSSLASANPTNAWERWSRVGFSGDLSTEWLVADDKVFENGSFRSVTPEKVTLYFLVPPTVTQAGRHWEITFDSTGKKKNLLAEHFNVSLASDPPPNGYHGAPVDQIAWHLNSGAPDQHFCPWLVIASKKYWNGERDHLTLDPRNTGSPTSCNLDPDDALGIAFLEPVVTEKDGEWLLTVASAPSDPQIDDIARNYAEWKQQHPGPREAPTPRKIVYPPNLQKEYDAWFAALKKWQADGAQGFSPRLEDYFHLSADQKAQYAAWEKARTEWMQTDGTTAFPQPVDYMKDEDSGPANSPSP